MIENDIQEEQGDVKMIELPNQDIEKDDIILVKSNEEENQFKNAYKIDQVENGKATVSN